MKKAIYSVPKLIKLGSMMDITKGHKSYCTDVHSTATTKHANSNCTG